MNYHHVSKMLSKANSDTVKMFPENNAYPVLPDNYMDTANEIETPILFMTGKDLRNVRV